MRVIVFDRELHEPLTVVEVPHWLAEQAKRGQQVRLMPRRSLKYEDVVRQSDVAEQVPFDIVTLTFERVMRHSPRGEPEVLFWYAYADSPETALLLRAAFLPGQVSEVQRREKRAYFMGLLT